MISTAPAQSLRDRAYARLRGLILAGKLSPGAVVSEASLARRMGISRTPVREAVQQLEREGLVEQVPRFGTIVRRLERRDLLELYELREALECYACRRAAERISAADLAAAERLCRQIDRVAGGMDRAGQVEADEAVMKRFLAADMGFHALLLRAAGNGRILRAATESRVLGRIFGARRQPHDANMIQATAREHQAVLAAVRQGDGPEAERAMASHLAASREAALRHFDQQDQAPRTLDAGLPAEVVRELQRIENDG